LFSIGFNRLTYTEQKSVLIEYCKLDTLAMVKILQKLKEI